MVEQDKHIKELTEQLSWLTAVATPALMQVAGSSPTTAKLDKYVGDPVRCHGFLLLCQLHFTSLGTLTEEQKLAQTISLSHLGYCCLEKGGENIAQYDRFLRLFRQVFDHASEGKEVGERLSAPNTTGNPLGTHREPAEPQIMLWTFVH